MDFLFLNPIVKFLVLFRFKYISPRIEKIKGKIAADKIIHKGKDLRIHGPVVIKGANNLKIGNYVRIGKGAFFSCAGGLIIGDNTQISRNVLIYTNSHKIESTSIPYDRTYINKPVKIGNSVWIGMDVIIAPGTVIKDGAVIGMGTVVSGKVPKGAIVVGPKQRIVGYRNMKGFDKKRANKKYFGLLFPDN